MSAVEYGYRALKAKPGRSAPCELCGNAEYKSVVHRVDGRRAAVVTRSTKRTTIEQYFADAAGHPELTGLRVCPSCYLVITGPANDAPDAVAKLEALLAEVKSRKNRS